MAVAVFPTYMGVYVTWVCSYQHTSLPEQLEQELRVKLQWSVSFHHCKPTFTIAMSTLLCVEKTWLQKKEIYV